MEEVKGSKVWHLGRTIRKDGVPVEFKTLCGAKIKGVWFRGRPADELICQTCLKLRKKKVPKESNPPKARKPKRRKIKKSKRKEYTLSKMQLSAMSFAMGALAATVVGSENVCTVIEEALESFIKSQGPLAQIFRAKSGNDVPLGTFAEMVMRKRSEEP